eukprot:scaffold587_cov339-Prasinococcus_capsulatus_cf.AAC.5
MLMNQRSERTGARSGERARYLLASVRGARGGRSAAWRGGAARAACRAWARSLATATARAPQCARSPPVAADSLRRARTQTRSCQWQQEQPRRQQRRCEDRASMAARPAAAYLIAAAAFLRQWLAALLRR